MEFNVLQCGRSCFETTVFCSKCAYMKKSKCSLCKLRGHERYLCPDNWRRYHLTIKEGKLKGSWAKFKPRESQWCSGCGQNGHLEFRCQNYIREHPPAFPLVMDYDDLYRTKKQKQQDSEISPNNNETPKRKSKTFELNNDTISTNESLKSNVEINHNQTPKRNESIEKNHEQTPKNIEINRDQSSKSNKNVQDQTPQSNSEIIGNMQLSAGNSVENILIKENQTVNLHIHGNYVNIQSPMENKIQTTDFYQTLLKQSEFSQRTIRKIPDVKTECILFTDRENLALKSDAGKAFMVNLRKKFTLPLELAKHNKLHLSCILVTATRNTCFHIKDDLMKFFYRVEPDELFTMLKHYLELLATFYLDYEEPSVVLERMKHTSEPDMEDYLKLNALLFGIHELDNGKHEKDMLIKNYNSYGRFFKKLTNQKQFFCSRKRLRKAIEYLFLKKRSVTVYLQLLGQRQFSRSAQKGYNNEVVSSPKENLERPKTNVVTSLSFEDGKDSQRISVEDGKDSQRISVEDDKDNQRISVEDGKDSQEISVEDGSEQANSEPSTSYTFKQSVESTPEYLSLETAINTYSEIIHVGDMKRLLENDNSIWKEFRSRLNNVFITVNKPNRTILLTGEEHHVKESAKRLKVFLPNFLTLRFPKKVGPSRKKCIKSIAAMNVCKYTMCPSAIYNEILELEKSPLNSFEACKRVGKLYSKLNSILFGKYQIEGDKRCPAALMEIFSQIDQRKKQIKKFGDIRRRLKIIYFYIFDFAHKGVDYKMLVNKFRNYDLVGCSTEFSQELRDSLVKTLETFLLLAIEKNDSIKKEEIKLILEFIGGLNNLTGVAKYVEDLKNTYR